MSLAIALPALMGVFGVAIDYGNLFLIRTELQTAVDGAVIFAAKQYSLASTKDSDIAATVKTYLDGELKTEEKLGDFGFTTTANAKDGTVTVDLSLAWTPFFAHFFDASVTPVRVTSTARFIGTHNLCVLTLDPASTKALHLDKSARLNAKGCSVYSDSAHRQAIRLDKDSTVTAGAICAVGGIMAKTTAINPEPVTDCPPVADPLKDRPAPEVKGCDFTNVALIDKATILTPGVYCGGLSIGGSSTVDLQPGLYIIKDGSLSISGKAIVKGTNVGFYLSGDFSLLDISGGQEIRLSGPESGPMAGLLFFEDHAAPVWRTHKITSPGVRELTGTIYLPNGKLFINPNAQVAEQSAYTAIVSYQLELTEGPELILNSNYGATKVPVPDGIKASSQVTLTN